MTEKEKELAQKRKKGSNPNDHDRREHEIKSDIETTRFELYNNDLYDLFDKDFKFDKSHIDFMKDNPDKFIKDVNLFDIYEDDVILEMMNTFTSTEDVGLTTAKYGGQLPKAQWWNPSKAYNTVKNVVKLNKYNKSKDAFGNTGKMLSNDITIPVSKAKSIVEYKGLKNTIPTTEELSQDYG